MRSAKSINSLAGQQQQQQQATNTNTNGRDSTNTASGPTSPICRCRVMYLGSSVPHITKDGLQGIQEPLRELYPDKSTLDSGNAGIDSWLSVWSNGILIENVDENGREVKRFFKIDALHYCAAVKYVGSHPQQQQLAPYTSLPNGTLANLPKFLPLDSPHARLFTKSPPVFASILRRTTGIKVLECHAFICKREAAANALVRCCFHAYADTMYAKQIEGSDLSHITSSTAKIDLNNNNSCSENDSHYANNNELGYGPKQTDGPMPPLTARRSKSIAALNEDGGNNSCTNNRIHPDHHTMMRRKSINEHYANGCDTSDNVKHMNNNDSNLRKQHKLSKSLHHLNQNGALNYGQQGVDCDGYPVNQSTSASCINVPPPVPPNSRPMQPQQVPPLPQQQPFYNPYSARVPSYPPQNMLEAANGGGTLRSIRSMAANSIASTLLRSKKHAKAMSMAQLNQEKIISFHQPHRLNGATISGPLLMPPVPPMFLPNLPARSIMNGSHTMKPTSRSMVMVPPQMNFEAMTPKEMKKLLKKSAKYGIDPSKFGENGLPLMPIRPPPPPIPMQLQPLPPQANHLTQHSQSGTMISQSMYSDMYGNDVPDMISMHSGLPPQPSRAPSMLDPLDQNHMKPILVKPNPEFLKTKAGKKWLKQQKEFKKLLPPHLDGLPIVFGPPPVGALEPACLPPPPPPPASHHNGGFPPPPPTFIPPPHLGLPMMDASGYYNPHPFYGQTGRASAASTLIRYSPNSQMMHDNINGISGPMNDADYMQRNHVVYSNGLIGPAQKDFSGDDSSMMYSGINESSMDGHSVRHITNNGFRHQQRNHMVEQSVISLGDENDYDDEEEAAAAAEEEARQQNDYYGVSHHDQEAVSHPRRSKSASRARNSEQPTYGHQQQVVSYEQLAQSNDDQSSYMSGIYKRGHINERAFSYSIRQEHKSGGAADSDDVPRNTGQHIENAHLNQENHHHRDQSEYYQGNNDSQPNPVNELTSRLESQLNMKSFANSRIKSHM